MLGLITKLGFTNVLLGVMITAFLGMAGTTMYYKNLAESRAEEVVDAQLDRDKAEAEAANSLVIIENYQDSLQVVGRRVVQLELENDELGERLGVEVAARAEAQLRVSTVRDSLSTVLESRGDVLRAEFNYREIPFTAFVGVTINPISLDSAKADIEIGLDPANMVATIGCTAVEGTDIRRADLFLTTPNWLDTEITSVQQDPEICNPQIRDIRIEPAWYKQPKYTIPMAIVGTLLGQKLLRN